METQSPFSLLGGLLARFSGGLPAALSALSALPPAPPWLVHEAQHRVVLLLNHVLQQEPEAMSRLARQRGRVAEVHWRNYSLALRATPAGLLNLVEGATIPDLRIELTETSPLALARARSPRAANPSPRSPFRRISGCPRAALTPGQARLALGPS